jgi:phosphoenolpyruvate carboxylase
MGLNKHLQSFNELIAMKYQIYNGLFLALPFEGIENTGAYLSLLSQACQEELQAGKTPTEIIEAFLDEIVNPKLTDKELTHQKIKILFQVVQFVERQVVLFDALEDAAFTQIRDIRGVGSLDNWLENNWLEYIETIKQDTQKAEALKNEIINYKTRIVLTAHPTQFYSNLILGIITELADSIESNELNKINNLLLQMGKTSFHNKQKPTPLEEAKSLMWYLENVFYEVLPNIQIRLIKSLNALDSNSNILIGVDNEVKLKTENKNNLYENKFPDYSQLELGFWPGGDRDGNPFVTSNITRQVASILKQSILKKYLGDINNLKRRLTFDGIIPKLENIEQRLLLSLGLDNTAIKIKEELFAVHPENKLDTYSENLLEEYKNAQEFLDDLQSLRRELIDFHQSLFIDQVENLINKINIFGFHFATLDLRQDSRIHADVLNEIFKSLFSSIHNQFSNIKYSNLGSEFEYKDLDLSQKREFIYSFLQNIYPETKDSKTTLDKSNDDKNSDTIESFKLIGDIQKANGERGLHRYIISNTQSDVNVLEIMALAKIANLTSDEAKKPNEEKKIWSLEELKLDIVPLFETIDDLARAQNVMELLYTNPIYQAHLKRRDNTQTIMLGFSDGTKDGGYITANWFILKAKRNLTELSRQYGIKAVFFDGRGGPPARGGGNTHKFYRSMGSDIEQKEIHLTIQGQTISSNFGTEQSALYSIEQLFTAGLESIQSNTTLLNLSNEEQLGKNQNHHDRKSSLNASEFELMEELSDISHKAYLELRNHELFLPYLQEVTPLVFYELLNIGSRPSKRKAGNTLRFEDLRAIPFVGAWTQMKQNISGFYGFGSGLKGLIAGGKLQALKTMYHNCLFFKTLVENAMQSLSKSHFPLTYYLKDDPKFGVFWLKIHDEAKLSEELLKEISGQNALLDSSPVNRESIRLREKIVLPLLTIQHYAMNKVRDMKNNSSKSNKEEIEAYNKIIIKSLAANVNASRNSV